MSLIGRKFGRLKVVREAGWIGPHRKRAWWVECRCGKSKVVKQNNLVSGKTKSCGCLLADHLRKMAGTAGLTHGDSYSREYRAWGNMRRRCYGVNGPRYKDWGGRGVQVCDRWRRSYSEFLKDMGRAPSKDHSLDRIDPDGNYEPGNCRWATRSEQQRNRRDNNCLTAFGRTQSIDDWADEVGITRATIRGRMRLGWEPEDIVTTPRQRKPRYIRMDGKSQTITEWAREYDIPVPTLHWRINRGQSLREALRL